MKIVTKINKKLDFRFKCAKFCVLPSDELKCKCWSPPNLPAKKGSLVVNSGGKPVISQTDKIFSTFGGKKILTVAIFVGNFKILYFDFEKCNNLVYGYLRQKSFISIKDVKMC